MRRGIIAAAANVVIPPVDTTSEIFGADDALLVLTEASAVAITANISASDNALLALTEASSVSASVTYATLNGTTANVTLSNGNLTATHANTTSQSGARSTALKNSGKWYFEATMTDLDGDWDSIGLLVAAGTFEQITDSSTNCAVCYHFGGQIWSNNGNSGKALGTLNDGDIIGVAVDLDNEKVWFRKAPSGNWNGEVIGSQDPASNVGGASISSFSITTMGPAVSFGGGGSQSGDNITVNFGASAFIGTVPSGFTSGWVV